MLRKMKGHKQIPRDNTTEGGIPLLLSDGYEFILKRCKKYHTDIFETRLMLKKTICLHGEEAAKLFYDREKFQRKNAVPNRVKASLFGKGGVQEMDGEAHVHRKQMFMSMMTPDRIRQLIDITESHWQRAIDTWIKSESLVLFDDVQKILTRAVCEWSGVPLPESEVEPRARDMRAMVEAFGAVGPRHWRGRSARKRSEKWIKEIIEQVRSGELRPNEQSALFVIAFHRDLANKLLDTHTAAVELINILRPTIAIDRYITFAAVALHQHPEYRTKLLSDDDLVEMFAQEVRRYFPYAPFVGAKVKEDFDWNGYHFPKGRLVLLDLYGTNHDERIWLNPFDFNAERFRNWDKSPYDFMPQGGGDHHTGHRCAGEWITIEEMKLGVKFLTRKLEYEVPDQDLSIRLTRMPAIPASRFIIQKVTIRG